jgi:four helix bundle protein
LLFKNLMHNYKKLNVWILAVDLAVEIYSLTKKFPGEEKFGMTSQLRKCAVSIPSNIAEGAGRNTGGEFIQFLGIAEGSANELETQMIIAGRLGFISTDEQLKTIKILTEIRKMLFSLRSSLRK